MRENKNKILFSFLALNMVAASYLNATTLSSKESTYNRMIKKLETGKSNKDDYHFLESVLKKRNKELKDLYIQGDYIIKPEYLEWQIFFSGFYERVKRGDNTLSNAEYYSMPKTNSGKNTISSEIYNSIFSTGVSSDTLEQIINGNINAYNNLSDVQKEAVFQLFDSGKSGEFKPLFNNTEVRKIDLGISLNIPGPEKNVSDIGVPNFNVPDVNITENIFTEPGVLGISKIDIVGFDPNIPVITTINFNPIPVLSLNGTGGGNGGITGFFPYGDEIGNNSIISQMDMLSGTVIVKTAGDPVNGQANNPGFYSYTLDNVLGNPSAGLQYDMRSVYDPVTMTWNSELAVLPTGIYNNSILNNPAGYPNQVQGVFKVIDNPITRFGTLNGNVSDLTVILEGDVIDAEYLEQILHYDEHYYGIYDPDTGMNNKYTLADMAAQGWISASEEAELAEKFLDTTLGFTAENRDFQYVENNSLWYLKGSNVVAVNIQAHGGYEDADSIFMNRGQIIGLNEASSTNNLIGKQVAFMFTEGNSQRKQEGFDNTGKIEFRAPESVIYLFTNNASSYNYYESSDSNGNNSIQDNPGKHILMNNGEMKLYGNSSIGVYSHNAPFENIYNSYDSYSDGSWSESHSVNNSLRRSEIRLYSPITVLGDQSIGVDLERELNFANSKIKVDVGTEDPRQNVSNSLGVGGLENSGNVSGGDNRYTDNSTGIYINMTGNIIQYNESIYDQADPSNNININETRVKNQQFTLSDYLLNIGEYSRSGAGIRVENYGDLILGNSTDGTTNHEINLLAGSEGNAGIYLHGRNDSIITYEPDPIWNPGYTETAVVHDFIGARVTTDGLLLNIAGNKQVGAQVEEYGYFYHNNGTITINGVNNTGIAIQTGGLGELNNTGIINVSSGNLGVYNNETFNMNGGSITADGISSVGIYSEAGTTNTNLNGGTLRAQNGGIALYAGSSSTINLNQGIDLTAGNKGLLFYNYDAGSPSGKYTITGNVNATVENGGIAFYLQYGTSLENYLNTSFTGISGGNLGLTMQSGSILYLIEGEGSTVSLSTLDGMVAPTTNLANNVNINPDSASDYVPISMNKGTLILNRNIDMDSNDLYERAQFALLSVTLNNGITLSGSQNEEMGIAQRNYPGSTGINDIVVTNNGTIDFTGSKGIGIVTDYGHIINNNIIKTTGDNSVAIASSNGSIADNNGEVIIGGNETAGIYGLNYLDGVTSSSVLGYGNDKIEINNNGKIISSGSGKVYGIYADNKKAQSESVITLGAASNINLQSSVGGIGLYVNNSILNGGGTLTVGTNGLGIYSKDSKLNLSGFNLNLHGDNVLGFYLDGTTEFTGTGNIDVQGTNVVLFNIQSSGTFNQNFNVTSSAGSSYSIGNIKNGTFYYNGTSNLSEGGNLINGQNSAVLIDSGAVITGTGNGIAGVVLDGQYTGGSLPGGFTSGIDAENRGNIALKSNSAGLYGTNGVRIKNTGSIKVEDASIGIQSKGIGSSTENTGTITIGNSSAGIYGSDSSSIINTGNILSNGNDSIGIYGDGNTSQTITNNGTIELTGNNGTGIYYKGTAPVSILNAGTLTIGDSTDKNKPGIGIYSQGSSDMIENTGTITSGASSVGIYLNGGTLTQKSLINVGEDGTGVYSSGGTVNLNSGSALNVNQQSGVGVYALNGTTIINDGTLTVGNNGFGYVLKSGSVLTNTTDSSIGNESIFVYGDGAGSITNSGTITMNSSKGVGFYTINGGNIQNTGNISGTAGTANVGIYNENGIINNTGKIDIGDSIIENKEDSTKNSYSIGIYGDNTTITNTGDISTGYYGVGIYSKNAPSVNNSGKINSSSEGVIGIFVENGQLENTGDITLSGNDSIGIYANKGSEVINKGTITMNGDNSTGIYLNLLSTIDNQGTININGNNSQGLLLKGGAGLINSGTINIAGGLTGSEPISYGGTSYPIPSIINAGIINVDENFEVNGVDISIKVDPTTIKAPTLAEDAGAAFVSDAVKFFAPSFNTTDPIGIMPGFASGTHENVYKLKDVFNPFTTDKGGPDSGIVNVRSKSLTWRATPVVNERGNVDIWMEKIPYDDFTSGLWYEDFGRALDSKFTGSTGKAGEIFDKIDTIETDLDFRRTMGNLAGEFYSNMNQREQVIERTFESSLNLLQDSENNTKENVKINVIAGKGKSTEDTDGVLDYDYTTTGVLALREVERTYKHTFGYSAGYMHTNFEMKDGNDSEEDADTIQLGLHSKYNSNDWVLRNDILGRVSFHKTERNMDWTNAENTELDGTYETYSISSNNRLGKEFSLGKNASVIPYGGFDVTYMTRPTFSENGLEALEVKGNDAWSVKPKVGVELKGEMPLGEKSQWKLKGSLDVAYGYELGNINQREYAKLVNVETDYHELAKPEKDKGELRTGAQLGVEIKDRYGVFITGEYTAGNDKNSDYRAGLALKAVF